MLLSLLDSELGSKVGSYLSQCPTSVHDSGTGGILDYLGVRSCLVATLANRPHVLGVTDDTVRIVSEEIGLNQMVHDGTRVGRSTP